MSTTTTIQIKNSLEKTFGIQGTDAILKYLSRIKGGVTESTVKDIDKLVGTIGEKIPSVENRYKRLTEKVDDPVTRLKIVCYIIKSIAHRLK